MSENIPFQSVYINSTPGYGGVTGTGSLFTTFLQGSPIIPQYGRTVRAAVTTATIPLTYYGINTTNNTLNVTETNGVTPRTFNVTLIYGTYTSTSLVTMLNAVMTAASAGSGYSMTYTSTLSTDTGLITFSTSTAGFTSTLNFGATTASIPLGLPTTGTSTGITNTTPYTSPNIVNIIGPTEIHIRCGNFLANIYETRVQAEAPILAIIPIVGNQFDSVVYVPAYPKLFGVVGARLDRLDFNITDEFGNNINLNGFGVKIQLAFYSEPSKGV